MRDRYLFKNTAAAATIHAGTGVLHSVTLAAGVDAATAIFYENTAASGTVICKLSAVATGSAHAVLDVAFGKGLHVAVTGTAPSVSVAYSP